MYIFETGAHGEKTGGIDECKLYQPRCLYSLNDSIILIAEGPEIKELVLKIGKLIVYKYIVENVCWYTFFLSVRYLIAKL